MIATDGSDCSILAAGKGIELAQMSGETVYAVYVVITAYYLRCGFISVVRWRLKKIIVGITLLDRFLVDIEGRFRVMNVTS